MKSFIYLALLAAMVTVQDADSAGETWEGGDDMWVGEGEAEAWDGEAEVWAGEAEAEAWDAEWAGDDEDWAMEGDWEDGGDWEEEWDDEWMEEDDYDQDLMGELENIFYDAMEDGMAAFEDAVMGTIQDTVDNEFMDATVFNDTWWEGVDESGSMW